MGFCCAFAVQVLQGAACFWPESPVLEPAVLQGPMRLLQHGDRLVLG